TLVVFFLLARRTLSPFASLAATALLAFSSWYLFFSRNGEVNVWATLGLLGAAYWCHRALASPRWDRWIWAGVCCGLGWYTYLSGVLILPTMLLYLGLAALLDRTVWKRALVGGTVLVLTTLVLVL